MFSVWRSVSCIVGKILPLTEAKTFSATVCPSIFLAGCLSVQVVVEVRLCLFIVLILLSQAMLRYFWYFMVSYGMAWKERYLLLLLLFVARLKIFGYRYQTPSVREKIHSIFIIMTIYCVLLVFIRLTVKLSSSRIQWEFLECLQAIPHTTTTVIGMYNPYR